jgi:hypothetical protein
MSVIPFLQKCVIAGATAIETAEAPDRNAKNITITRCERGLGFEANIFCPLL